MAIKDTSRKPYIIDNDTNVKVGIDLPFRRGDEQDGFFATTSTTIEAVKNNMRNLLQTEEGERLFQPNLGMNLKRFLFEQVTENTVIEIENDIVSTFERWLPFVQLDDIQVDISNQDRNQIKIDIKFNIINVPSELQSVGVVLE